jgi:hypothetical protein
MFKRQTPAEKEAARAIESAYFEARLKLEYIGIRDGHQSPEWIAVRAEVVELERHLPLRSRKRRLSSGHYAFDNGVTRFNVAAGLRAYADALDAGDERAIERIGRFDEMPSFPEEWAEYGDKRTHPNAA